jgi:hypothetical protein
MQRYLKLLNTFIKNKQMINSDIPKLTKIQIIDKDH